MNFNGAQAHNVLRIAKRTQLWHRVLNIRPHVATYGYSSVIFISFSSEKIYGLERCVSVAPTVSVSIWHTHRDFGSERVCHYFN